MKNIFLNIFIFCSSIVFFNSCGSNESISNVQIVNNEDYTDFLLVKSLNINNMQINVGLNTSNNVGKSLKSMDSMLQHMTNILEKNTQTLINGMNLLDMMAQEFSVDTQYRDIFIYNANYTENISAFSMQKVLNENFLLLVSSYRFYPEGSTLKTYFTSDNDLQKAWLKSMASLYNYKELYVKIIRVNKDGSTYNVTNTLWIKRK